MAWHALNDASCERSALFKAGNRWYVAVRPAGGQLEVKGQRGFGSAVQALLRYLGSMTSSLGIVGSPADPPVKLPGPPLTVEGKAIHLTSHDMAAESDGAKPRHVPMACMETLSAYISHMLASSVLISTDPEQLQGLLNVS